MLQQIEQPSTRPARPARRFLESALAPFASLRLTVGLLAMAMVVIFAGTWAQIDQGIWSVQKQYFYSFFCWIDLRLFLPREPVKSAASSSVIAFLKPVGFPMLGGYSLVVLLLINLVAAHLLRFKLQWKRAGIILIHAGLILLVLGDVVTSMFAVEQQMTIWRGQTMQWAQDIRETEFAVIDPSPTDHDDVVAFPRSRISAGATLADDRVPFTARIDRYYANSMLFDPQDPDLGPFQKQQLKARADQLQTAGFAATDLLGIIPLPRVKGTDADKIDAPSAFVTLTGRDGANLGTYLVSTILERGQDVTVGDRTYQVALRFRRYYKPYTITALKLDHDVYTGTDVAKNFASTVRLVDAQQGVDREVRIWMNHPLRYAGETFYQSGFDREGKRFTTLQVVKNPGWLVPYIACSMVSLGMVIHFGRALIVFLLKRSSLAVAPAGARPAPISWTSPGMVWPAIVTLIVGVYLLSLGRPLKQTAGGMDMDAFGRLPVSYEGRVMPLDSLARNSLRIISGRATFTDDTDRTSHPAIDFAADALAARESAWDHKLFRIDHPEIKSLLGLKETETRFSFRQIAAQPQKLEEQFARAAQVPPKERDLYQKKLAELSDHLQLFLLLAQDSSRLFLVPPAPGAPPEEWRQLAAVVKQQGDTIDTDVPAAHALLDAFNAYHNSQRADFNAVVANYHADLREQMPELMRKMDLEVLFNRFEPFYVCMMLYVTVAVLGFGYWLFSGTSAGAFLGRTATGILILTLIVHSLGLTARIYLSGRPPVTNLYSSAIFIAWAGVVLCVGLELVYRNGIASVVGASLAAPSLIIAHYLAADGDTMKMLQAVLDTNFWLATHVVVVTLGYAATFLAGALGIAYVVARLSGRNQDGEALTRKSRVASAALTLLLAPFTGWAVVPGGSLKTLSRMLYGVVCFAMLFSFVGTILGGIWADQSWGRFWGWDPKENGAVLIVLWNAIILHSRWGGIAGPRGVALLAMFGNVVTSWSWFGTNMLGIGLHSYGFMDSAVFWLGLFIFIQLSLILLGWLVPFHWWRSNGG